MLPTGVNDRPPSWQRLRNGLLRRLLPQPGGFEGVVQARVQAASGAADREEDCLGARVAKCTPRSFLIRDLEPDAVAGGRALDPPAIRDLIDEEEAPASRFVSFRRAWAPREAGTL